MYKRQPSEAFNETVEELTQSLMPLFAKNGMDWMYANCSTTAQRGALDWICLLYTSHAAQGFARVSGEVGVCLVTSGPGATNTITGIADAMIDSTQEVRPYLAGNDNDRDVYKRQIFLPSLSMIAKLRSVKRR